MSRAPDALQIELRFRNAASQLINIAIGRLAGNLPC
jgi:hypothetical protein